MIYLKLGIRNLLRNKRRALIAGSAIGIGLAALMLTDAFMEGMQRNLIHSATASFLGDGQIHREGYREMPEVESTIFGRAGLVSALSSDPRVEYFTERVMSFAMVASPANLAAIQLVGVTPATEVHLSQIDEAIQAGAFLSGDSPRDLVLGSKLAEILEVETGDRVVITVAEAGTGQLAQEMFRVSGIYHFNISEMDRAMAFVLLKRAQQMLGMGEAVHEVALKLRGSSYDREADAGLWADYSIDGNEAVGWPVLLPQLKLMLEMSQFSLGIISLILFAIVALGIVNTLFMSLHERMFEFGVLRAVGTRPSAMAWLILIEAAALALLAVALGLLLGLLTIVILGETGLDYTGIEALGVTFRELLYPAFRHQQFTIYPVAVLLATLLIALYPAIHAARLRPAEAMRRSF